MIDVKNLKKSFGDVHVLKGITTHVNKGECICIIGPSGSGKSTFLRCLNLLEKPEEGEITVNGQQLLDPKLDVDKFRENVGMVFQHFNLFPNMTVLKNITLAPVRLGKWNVAEADQKARALLKRVGLEEKADVYPGKLSGGQKQRVAIAGILAMKPKCIVLDEPTAMLDPNGRKEVIATITKLNKEEHVTVILITHYMDEVIGADKVFVMDEGKVVLNGTPREVFSKVEHLKALRLDVPHTTELAFELEKAGLPMKRGILTIEEFTQELIKAAKRSHIDRRSTSC